MPCTMHVVSHTHWDREWHLTFQQFRLRLVDLIDHLLDLLEADPEFRSFNLDAQTIVLEDYLQIRPHARERLERHIQAGRITIGPWYQLNDEFLVSGEATVRSLLVGRRIAQEFGACMSVGYLPDQFGNVSQMPQILNGFGIDNAILGRGRQLATGDRMEFWWEAPDGSRVVASLMALWYNNAQYLPSDPDRAVEFVENLREAMSPISAVDHLLFMNGVDHLEPQPEAGRVVAQVDAALRARGSGDRILHSSLPEYVAGLRQAAGEAGLAVRRGELRDDRGGACLAGVLSTRMYLKQANHRAQQALERYAEPLAAFARIDGGGYPHDELTYAWKLLMQNHPHDSICGCSVDQVHDEMMPRFQQVEQIAGELVERALDRLTARDRTRGATDDLRRIVVLNTLNWPRTDPVTVTLRFPLSEPLRGGAHRDPAREPAGFRILDPSGREVAFAVTRSEAAIETVLNPRELPLDQWVRRITVEFIAEDVPACGYKAYTIEPCRAMPQYPASQDEPDAYQPLCLEDGGDVGDEYLYRAPLNDRLMRWRPSRASVALEGNAVRRTYAFSHTLQLPARATDDGQSRSTEMVECPLTLRVTRWAGSPRTEVRLDFENRAKDHRLRVRFDQAAIWQVRDETYADSAFDVVARPLGNPQAPEGAAPYQPQLTWSAVVGESGWVTEEDHEPSAEQTLTVMARGLPEHEVSPTSEGGATLALTLLRCVGQLSGRGDGPGIATPGAQCLGRHTLEFATTVTRGCWRGGGVWRQAHQFVTPLLAVQCPAAEGSLAERSFVSVQPSELIVTAVKRAMDRDTLVVRFFNTTDDAVSGVVRVFGAGRMRRVDLDEQPVADWSSGDALHLSVGAKSIVTVEAEV